MDGRRQIADNESMPRQLSRPAGPLMSLDKLQHRQLAYVVVICVPILVSGCLVSGCADSELFSPVAPGKYDFLDCPSIAKRLARALYQEAQLTQLMTRASEGAGGAVVNAMVYQDRYNLARAEVRALRKAEEDKKCPPSNSTPPTTEPQD
jgi:hypothetical protein